MDHDLYRLLIESTDPSDRDEVKRSWGYDDHDPLFNRPAAPNENGDDNDA